MNRRALEAMRKSSEVGIILADARYAALRKATHAALASEGLSLQCVLDVADQAAELKEAEDQRTKRLQEQKAAEEAANVKLIARILHMLPGTNKDSFGRDYFMAANEDDAHALLDTGFWRCSKPKSFEKINYVPSYIIGYSYTQNALLLANAEEDNNFRRYFPSDYATVVSYQPQNRAGSKLVRQLGNVDARLIGNTVFSSPANRVTRSLDISSDSPGAYVQRQRYGILSINSYIAEGAKAVGYGWKALPDDVLTQYNVDHWLLSLASRFQKGQEYLALLDDMIAPEPTQ